MKFIQRKDIDLKKWDALVKSDSINSVFSLATYLDAVSENWCVLTDDNYSNGIALPYSNKFGVKTCYTPIFVRELNWCGEKTIENKHLFSLLKNEFAAGQLSSSMLLSEEQKEEFIYQSIEKDQEVVLNSQAKRMLAKFKKSSMSCEFVTSTDEVFQHIYKELPKKVSSLNERSLASLEKLVAQLQAENLLKVLVVKEEGEVVGGIFLVEFNGSLLYLKGAFTAESKKEGAMYAIMEKAIAYSKEKGLNFDFGGSRVEGVRRFNVNLGGEDRVYYSYNWDNAPLWFKWLKKAKQAWKRK